MSSSSSSTTTTKTRFFINGIGVAYPNIDSPITTKKLVKVCNLGEDITEKWIDEKIKAWQRYTVTTVPFDDKYHRAVNPEPLPPIESYAHPVRIKDGCANSDLCASAGRRALAQAGLSANDVDLLIVSTCTPDFPTPSTATIVQDKMGMQNDILVMDVRSSCSGSTQAMQSAVALMSAEPGRFNNALIISSDVGSVFGVLDKDEPYDKKHWEKGDAVNAALIGDAAGAFVISPKKRTVETLTAASEESLIEQYVYEIVDIFNGSMGVGKEKGMYLPCGGCIHPPTRQACLDGHNKFAHSFSEVLKYGPQLYLCALQKICERNAMTPNDARFVLPHQANAIVSQLAVKVGVDPKLLYNNFRRVGNTANASLPLLMWDLDRSLPSTDHYESVEDQKRFNDYATLLSTEDKGKSAQSIHGATPLVEPNDVIVLVAAESTKWLYGAVLLKATPVVARSKQSDSAKTKKKKSTFWGRAMFSFRMQASQGLLGVRTFLLSHSWTSILMRVAAIVGSHYLAHLALKRLRW